jgi:hypothetical protein
LHAAQRPSLSTEGVTLTLLQLVVLFAVAELFTSTKFVPSMPLNSSIRSLMNVAAPVWQLLLQVWVIVAALVFGAYALKAAAQPDEPVLPVMLPTCVNVHPVADNEIVVSVADPEQPTRIKTASLVVVAVNVNVFVATLLQVPEMFPPLVLPVQNP